ncbi:hypothetical protein OBA40_03460 [Alphaproteobacteria bacterium]|nr:hypothetical protein [Alphaproteobacteria bacterium]
MFLCFLALEIRIDISFETSLLFLGFADFGNSILATGFTNIPYPHFLIAVLNTLCIKVNSAFTVPDLTSLSQSSLYCSK